MLFLVYDPLCAYHPYVSCFKSISYRCCFSTSATIAEKFSLHNQWTLLDQQLLEGSDFWAYYSMSAKCPSNLILNKYMLGELNSKVFSLTWQVKHFTFMLLSRVYLRMIRTNKPLCFCSFVILSTKCWHSQKFCLIFVLDLTQPYQSSSGWFSFIITISLKFDLRPRTRLQITWCDFSHVAIA